MGPFLAVLEAKLRDLRPTWKHLGANLGRFVANLAFLDATQHAQLKAKQCVFISLFEHRRVKKEKQERKGRKKSKKENSKRKEKTPSLTKKVKAALRHVSYSVFWNQPGSCVVVDHSTKAVCSLLVQVPQRSALYLKN